MKKETNKQISYIFATDSKDMNSSENFIIHVIYASFWYVRPHLLLIMFSLVISIMIFFSASFFALARHLKTNMIEIKCKLKEWQKKNCSWAFVCVVCLPDSLSCVLVLFFLSLFPHLPTVSQHGWMKMVSWIVKLTFYP